MHLRRSRKHHSSARASARRPRSDSIRDADRRHVLGDTARRSLHARLCVSDHGLCPTAVDLTPPDEDVAIELSANRFELSQVRWTTSKSRIHTAMTDELSERGPGQNIRVAGVACRSQRDSPRLADECKGRRSDAAIQAGRITPEAGSTASRSAVGRLVTKWACSRASAKYLL